MEGCVAPRISSVDIGAKEEERADGLDIAVERSQVQRRIATRVNNVHIGPCHNERKDGSDVPILRGSVEGLEAGHGVTISHSSVQCVMRKSDVYVLDQRRLWSEVCVNIFHLLSKTQKEGRSPEGGRFLTLDAMPFKRANDSSREQRMMIFKVSFIECTS